MGLPGSRLLWGGLPGRTTVPVRAALVPAPVRAAQARGTGLLRLSSAIHKASDRRCRRYLATASAGTAAARPREVAQRLGKGSV